MADEFYVQKSGNNNLSSQNENGKIIDESKFNIIRSTSNKNPSAIGRGGDPLFRRISATPEQLSELLEETTTVQDWVQRETSNNVALSCLDNENLKEVYFQIKDGFGDYGPILLMGFKNPQGVEIPRLKVLDTNGEVIEVLTGPMAIDELNKRALAYKESLNGYEPLDIPQEETGLIQDYSGSPEDYA